MRKIAFAFVIFVVPQCAPAQPAWENRLDRAERQFLRMRPSDARDLFLDVQRQAGQLPAGDLRRARLSVLLASTYADMGNNSRAIPLLEDSRQIWETAGIERSSIPGDTQPARFIPFQFESSRGGLARCRERS